MIDASALLKQLQLTAAPLAAGLLVGTACAGVPSTGTLTIAAEDCQQDAFPDEAGFQVEVTLSMSDLSDPATGFNVFLQYDQANLDYRGDLSMYTAMPFETHIIDVTLAEVNPGELNFDGSTFMMPSMADALLLTMVFDVITTPGDCGFGVPVEFRPPPAPTIGNELSFMGVPFDTTLVEPGPVTFDNEPPAITCPADVMGVCMSDADPDNSGMATATDNCTAEPVITFSDSSTGSGCAGDPMVITRTFTATDDCGNTTTCEQTITLEDNEAPMITCPDDVELNADAGGCDAILDGNETFDSTPPLCDDQTPDCWYIDRFPPAVFTNEMFNGDNRLRDGVNAADEQPDSFNNFQGRKYDIDLPLGSTLAADIYISSDWMTNNRNAGMWATMFDANGDVSGFPILNANSDGTDQVFRIFTQDINQDSSDGFDPGFVELGPIPTFDAWYRFETELTSSTYEFRVLDDTDAVIYSFSDTFTFDSIRFGNVILQLFNYGETYDVFWDNVTLGPQGPIVTDNCDDFPDITITRSDGDPPGDPFPAGDTTVTYTATDDCGNSASCDQIVTVNPVNEAEVSVELVGSGMASRCIHFELLDCDTGDSAELDMILDFDSSGFASETIEIPCGDWDQICAKDQQHTLWDTQPLVISGNTFVTGDTLSLEPGDNDNDADVDINDVTFLVATFGNPAVDGGCPYDGTRDSDFDNDGAVGSSDYSLLSSNFLTFNSCSCPIALAPREVPGRTAVPTTDLAPWVAQRADLNGDEIVDWKDVRLFETRENLPRTISTGLRMAERQSEVNQK